MTSHYTTLSPVECKIHHMLSRLQRNSVYQRGRKALLSNWANSSIVKLDQLFIYLFQTCSSEAALLEWICSFLASSSDLRALCISPDHKAIILILLCKGTSLEPQLPTYHVIRLMLIHKSITNSYCKQKWPQTLLSNFLHLTWHHSWSQRTGLGPEVASFTKSTKTSLTTLFCTDRSSKGL